MQVALHLEPDVAEHRAWILNEHRQILYGNVGYRVIEANVQELLRSHAGEASWR